mgnify:CR=1 FL=1
MYIGRSQVLHIHRLLLVRALDWMAGICQPARRYCTGPVEHVGKNMGS